MIDWTQTVGKFIIQDKPYFVIHYVIKIEHNYITVKNIKLSDAFKHQDITVTLHIDLMSPNFRIMTDLEKMKYL